MRAQVRARPVLLTTTVIGLAEGIGGITAGDPHHCQRPWVLGGGVKCWGWNSAGQLGDGTTHRRLVPTDVWGLSGYVAAIAAGGQHSCVLTTRGRVG